MEEEPTVLARCFRLHRMGPIPSYTISLVATMEALRSEALLWTRMAIFTGLRVEEASMRAILVRARSSNCLARHQVGLSVLFIPLVAALTGGRPSAPWCGVGMVRFMVPPLLEVLSVAASKVLARSSACHPTGLPSQRWPVSMGSTDLCPQ